MVLRDENEIFEIVKAKFAIKSYLFGIFHHSFILPLSHHGIAFSQSVPLIQRYHFWSFYEQSNTLKSNPKKCDMCVINWLINLVCLFSSEKKKWNTSFSPSSKLSLLACEPYIAQTTQINFHNELVSNIFLLVSVDGVRKHRVYAHWAIHILSDDLVTNHILFDWFHRAIFVWCQRCVVRVFFSFSSTQ